MRARGTPQKPTHCTRQYQRRWSNLPRRNSAIAVYTPARCTCACEHRRLEHSGSRCQSSLGGICTCIHPKCLNRGRDLSTRVGSWRIRPRLHPFVCVCVRVCTWLYTRICHVQVVGMNVMCGWNAYVCIRGVVYECLNTMCVCVHVCSHAHTHIQCMRVLSDIYIYIYIHI